MTRTTVIYSPHPDDETLRLTAYILMCRERGDNLILVSVTEGEATGARRALGMSYYQVAQARNAEQAAAWSYLTGGQGEVIRMGLPDGGVAARRGRITTLANRLNSQSGPDVEHYCACRLDDSHADHRAVAQAVRDSNARVVRYAQPPDVAVGTVNRLPDNTSWSANRARLSYSEVGFASVKGSFDQLRARNYTSYTAPK